MTIIDRFLVRPGLSAAKKLVGAKAESAMQRPFYSAVDKAIEDIVGKQPKGTGDQYLAMILKTKGVKPAEVKDRGLDVALKGKGKTTGAELQKLAEDRPPVEIVQRTLKSDPIPSYDELLDLESKASRTGDWSEYDRAKDLIEMQEKGIYGEFSPGRTMYSGKDYTAQTGSNYREILIKLPRDESSSQSFVNKHYGDEGLNTLAHARVQDMRGPEGQKILLIDEIQSDWHQAGRKRGYRSEGDERVAATAIPQEGYFEVRDQHGNFVANVMNHDMTNPSAEAALTIADRRISAPEIGRQADDIRVPDAPFKNTWHELTMKRLVDDAARNGYDKVVFSPASLQKVRYPDSGAESLYDLLYDQKLPKFVSKEYGVDVDQYPVKTKDLSVIHGNRGGFTIVERGSSKAIGDIYETRDAAEAAAKQMSEVPYHSFDITPEMRERITTQGQPLYQLAPVAGAIGAGMMATDEEPTEYKKGGKVKKPVSLDAMRLAVMSK